MPKTDDDHLGPFFDARLRAELDRIEPPNAAPRYVNARAAARIGAWRLAPALLAVGLSGILGVTAWAATGSTNPAVWTQRVVTVVHPSEPSPTPESAPSQAPAVPAHPASEPEHPATPRQAESPEPTGEPERGASPTPSESPQPSDDHSGEGSSGGSGNPSPTPDDH